MTGVVGSADPAIKAVLPVYWQISAGFKGLQVRRA